MATTMDPSIWLALIAAVSTAIVSPVIVAVVANWNRASERVADYARQDAVAARAEKNAAALLERQDKAAKLLLESNKIVEETARISNGKLDVIHTLVNSNMTSAMQSELDATGRELAMMLEVIELKKVSGLQPTEEVISALGATRGKIVELQAMLADRRKQSELVATMQNKHET
jgi:biopolymer transport protein ExbB/TolQ